MSKVWTDGVWKEGLWKDGLWRDDSVPPPAGGGGFVGGTAVDDTGVIGTIYLGDGVPVPAGAVYINGFAHSQTGQRYVCPWPASGAVTHHGGIARRPDGAMCVLLAGAIACHVAGWGMTARGEVIVSTGTPDLVLGGIGLKQAGDVCVSEAA